MGRPVVGIRVEGLEVAVAASAEVWRSKISR